MFKQKRAYEIWYGLVGWERCIRDSPAGNHLSIDEVALEVVDRQPLLASPDGDERHLARTGRPDVEGQRDIVEGRDPLGPHPMGGAQLRHGAHPATRQARKEDSRDCRSRPRPMNTMRSASYTHLRPHATVLDPVCRLPLAKKKKAR